MYKTIDDISAALSKHFERSYADAVAAELLTNAPEGWPHVVSLGRVSTAELTSRALEVAQYVRELRTWCMRYGLIIEEEVRRFGAAQPLPARVVAETPEVSAAVAGRVAQTDLAQACQRAARLVGEQGIPRNVRQNAKAIAHVLRSTKDWPDTDYDLLLAASAWFAQHDADGLTSRQVPLDGFHAKWLDAKGRRTLVCLLAGREELGLVDRPFEVSLAYLDPSWRATGGRHYDSYVQGDAFALPYAPRFVLVVENKDSYLFFPEMPGGVCVFGKGKAGPAQLAELPWVKDAPAPLYWGDMDADGLEILNDYRAAGLDVTSLCMDVPTFERYERFGTRAGARGQDLAKHAPRDVSFLTTEERALYERLTGPAWKGALRVEQERIPLHEAMREVERILGRQAHS